MSTNRYRSFGVYPVSTTEEEISADVDVGYKVSAEYLDLWRYLVVKRAFDVVVALVLILAVLLPVGGIVALLICLTCPGPVFFREERIGRFGKHFKIWKFRSMRVNATQLHSVKVKKDGDGHVEWRMQKNEKDPRITPLGGILRRWSIDEIPQLINVIRGDMSLVGPRPIVESERKLYRNLLHYYLEAVPGMTGIWQVSGRNQINYEQRAKLDKEYVRTWSLLGDMKILAKTIPAVLRRIGAS